MNRLLPVLLCLLGLVPAHADLFVLPTPNTAIYQPNPREKYFVETPGRTWEAGTFGCVRTEGMQMHEGLDIRCVQRDKRGEALDPIYAAAPGKVAYINNRTALSNYGKYIILLHQIEGMPIYTTYAHLSEIASGLRTGSTVRQGDVIGRMGRTSNTRQAISKERAHLHFEVNLKMNDRFAAWFKKVKPKDRNDHGVWNGRNMLGLDPRAILIESKRQGDSFSLASFIRERTELCRVLVRDTRFSWLKAYTPLVRRNPLAEQHGVAAYEIALDYNGVPFQLIPRTAQEAGKGPRVELLSVNASEQASRPCRKLVTKQNGSWRLNYAGSELIDLLTF